MKAWGTIKTEDKIMRDAVIDLGYMKKTDAIDYSAVIHALCLELDLARPVILKKHVNDLRRFSSAVFKSEDFMEHIDFDQFHIQLYFDKKKSE